MLVAVAVAGGAGGVGARLSRRLLADGVAVRSLDRAPIREEELAREVSELRGDLGDPAACRRLVRRASGLVHLALGAPTDATATLLAAAAEAGVARVVALSSAVRPREEGERVCADFVRRGLDVVVLRPAPVVDPERPGPLGLVLDRIRAGKAIPLPGDGSQRVALLAAEDLGAAIVRALEAPGPLRGAVLELGPRAFGTVREELEALVAHADTGATLRPVPARLAELPLLGLERSGLLGGLEGQLRAVLRDTVVSNAEAEAALGWTPLRSSQDVLRAAYDAQAAERAHADAGEGEGGGEGCAPAGHEASPEQDEGDPLALEELALRLLRRLR
jgi:nucleoside-diphosphate-sugar epimerase